MITSSGPVYWRVYWISSAMVNVLYFFKNLFRFVDLNEQWNKPEVSNHSLPLLSKLRSKWRQPNFHLDVNFRPNAEKAFGILSKLFPPAKMWIPDAAENNFSSCRLMNGQSWRY